MRNFHFSRPGRHTLRPISGQLSKLSNNFSFSSVLRVLSFVLSLSLSLSSHSSIRESLAVPIRGRNLGRFIASVSDTVVIFTPGITFKGYICITEKLGKLGNWGISGGLIYCGVMKSFMEVFRGVVRIFPLPIFKKEIFVLRNTKFF